MFVLINFSERLTNSTINRSRLSSLGATWENEQELNAHPAAIISLTDDESGYFEKLGAKTESVLEYFFTKWGTYCASKPWLVLFLGECSDERRGDFFFFLILRIDKFWKFVSRFLFPCVHGPWHQVFEHHNQSSRIMGIAELTLPFGT